jgi:lipoate-protein ligase B
MRVTWAFLGRVPYAEALRLQRAAVGQVQRGGSGMLLLLEHPPTITLGRHADPRHLLLPEAEYRRRGIPIFRVKRGGDVTYHGPGQLIGYPIVSLDEMRISVPDWVRGNAEAIAEFLESRGVRARWSQDRPGVWVGDDKIAAVGFHIERRVSSHGFAINLDVDLLHFGTIVPCGLAHCGVTSLKRLGADSLPMPRAAEEVARRLATRFGWELAACPPGEFLARESETVRPCHATIAP